MISWKEFAQQAPELAEFGKARFQSGVAYLGTLHADGGPRVHPVTPIIGEQVFLFMEPTSPKGKDLQRDAHWQSVVYFGESAPARKRPTPQRKVGPGVFRSSGFIF